MRYKSTYGTRTFGRRFLNESRLLTEATEFDQEMDALLELDPGNAKLKVTLRALRLFLNYLQQMPANYSLKVQVPSEDDPGKTKVIEIEDLKTYVAEQVMTMFMTSQKLKSIKQDVLQAKVKDFLTKGPSLAQQAAAAQQSVNTSGGVEESRYRTGRMVESRRPALNRKPTRRYL